MFKRKAKVPVNASSRALNAADWGKRWKEMCFLTFVAHTSTHGNMRNAVLVITMNNENVYFFNVMVKMKLKKKIFLPK